MKTQKTLVFISSLFISILLIGCAGTTTETGNDASERDYNINASNNQGTINLDMNLEKSDSLTAETSSQGGTVSPETDLAAAIAEQGGTTSLAAEGGKLALEGISSLYKYLTEKNEVVGSDKTNSETEENGTTVIEPDHLEPEKTDDSVTTNPDELTTESLRYVGRTNGDRPTWYGNKKMNQYPKVFVVTIEGCTQFSVNDNNGKREVNNGVIVKQSDVSGRGLALVGLRSCKATEASISYVK